MNSLRIQPRVSLERLTYGVLLTLAFAWGCGETPTPLIPTFAVTGQVVYRNGQPVTSGIVQFQSKTNPTLNMSSPIGEDGTFALQTIQGNQSVAGAVEGECEVMITLIPTSATEPPELIILPKPYRIETTDNHFIIRLDRSGP